MPICSDQELLQVIGLGEQVAASLLNKSRQTVNMGLKRGKNYFRSDELGRLLSHCSMSQPTNVEAVKQYIRESRGDLDATEALLVAEFLDKKRLILTGEAILSAKEIWITIPDFRYFKMTYPDVLAALCKRAAADPKTFEVLVSAEVDHPKFWEMVGSPAGFDKAVVKEAIVDSWPYTLILEPSSNSPTAWVLVAGGFQQIDGLRTDGMLSALKYSRRS